MRIRSPRDFWAGLVFIAIAGAFAWIASGYRFGSPQRMGPGLFPYYVAGLLSVLGLITLVRSFMADGPRVEGIGLRQLVVTIAAVVAFGVTLSYAGLVAAIVVLVVVSAFADPTSRLVETIALAVFLAAFSVGVFVYMLGLPLPVWPEGFSLKGLL